MVTSFYLQLSQNIFFSFTWKKHFSGKFINLKKQQSKRVMEVLLIKPSQIFTQPIEGVTFKCEGILPLFSFYVFTAGHCERLFPKSIYILT